MGISIPAGASAGKDLPRIVVARGSGATARVPAGALRPLTAAGRTEFAREAARVRAAERPFPDDLYAPGAVRPALRPVKALLQEGLAAAASAAPPETLRVAIIRVDFLQDSKGDSTTGDGRFDLRTGAGGPVDPPPHDRAYFEAHGRALARFYDVQSYGSLVIVPTVFPPGPDGAYHLRDTADYGPWEVAQSSEIVRNATGLITDALHAADASGDIDFSAFGAFVLAHAGPDFQSDVNRDSPGDIPTFTLSLGDSIELSGGARVGRVLVLPETAVQDGEFGALNGVFAHEFGHVLGLPDLYNICNGVPQIGYWTLMDSGENIPAIVVDYSGGDTTEVEARGIFPTSFDPWCKLQLFPRAMAPILTEEHWAGNLEATEVNPAFPVVDLDDSQHFFVENRALDLDGNGFPYVQQDSTTGVFMGPVDDPDLPGQGGRDEYDAVLPGGGVLIWHIDDLLVNAALAGVDFGDGCPGNFNLGVGFRAISVVEADGVWDEGRFNLGVPEDAFSLSNNPLLGPDTVPSSAADDGAWTGIAVHVDSDPARFMAVSVDRPLARNGWPRFLRSDAQVSTQVGGVAVADLDGDGKPEVLYGADIKVTGEARHRFGLLALRGDGIPYDGPSASTGDSRFALSVDRLDPGLAVSDAYALTEGGAARTVIAAVAGGRPLLWDAAGTQLLTGRIDDPALTAPVLDTGSGAGRLLYGGAGGLFAVVGNGDRVLSFRSAAAAGRNPTAPPVVLPRGSGLEAAVFALAYEGGRVEFYPENGASPDPIERAGATLSGDPIHLVAGRFLDRQGEPGTATGLPRVVAFTRDSVAVVAPDGRVEARWALPTGSGTATLPPALGDLDGDGDLEIAAVTDSGLVAVWNRDGSSALGWPRQVAAPPRDFKLADLDGDGRLDVLVLDGYGRFQGLDGRGRALPTYPRAVGGYDVHAAWLSGLDGDGRLSWVAAAGNAALPALRLPGPAAAGGDWRYPGGDPSGTGYQDLPGFQPAMAGAPDLGADRLIVFPNPARDAVEIRFLLDTGENAKLSLYDLAGREITGARLDTRGGYHPGENAVRWDLDGVAPGLYFCRLERSGGPGGGVDMKKIAVMR